MKKPIRPHLCTYCGKPIRWELPYCFDHGRLFHSNESQLTTSQKYERRARR